MKKLYVVLAIMGFGIYLMLTEKDKKKTKKKKWNDDSLPF
jgi:hypothetical protein